MEFSTKYSQILVMFTGEGVSRRWLVLWQCCGIKPPPHARTPPQVPIRDNFGLWERGRVFAAEFVLTLYTQIHQCSRTSKAKKEK